MTADNDWRCAGCGAPGIERSCDCPTDVVFRRRDGVPLEHGIKIDKPDQKPATEHGGFHVKQEIEQLLLADPMQFLGDAAKQEWAFTALRLLLQAELGRIERMELERKLFIQMHSGNLG
jgi:hypothetical protein